MTTFHPFRFLPLELRRSIFNLTMSSTTTIHIREDNYDVTYVSSPPASLTINREARKVAREWELEKYPIWAVDDWQDIYLSPQNTILEIVIAPSKSASLNITWTELHAILGDALLAVKYLHVVCSTPERLARLFMLPEGEIVGVGESCVEKGLFGSEVISSDRVVRESLQEDLLVTTSKFAAEDIGHGVDEGVNIWKVGDEDFSNAVGSEAEAFTTKALQKLEVNQCAWKNLHELHEVAKASGVNDYEAIKDEAGAEKVEEEQLEEKSGEDLTDEALRAFTLEMARLHPDEAYNSSREDPGGSIVPEYD